MKYFVILLFTLLAFVMPLLSQELSCTITINTESIQSAQRDYLRSFTSDVEQYMNNTLFTNEDLDGEKIQCNLNIVFVSASSDNRYQAQVVITSERPIYIGNDKSDRTTPVVRILDNSWQFNYMPNQRMNHNEVIFDPLTGFLDFYAYLIIGFDLETYLPMSGTKCFQKALNIVQLASNSTVASDWRISNASYSKFGITDELNSIKFNSFRNAFNNYYFEGIDSLSLSQQRGLKNMLSAIESINDVRRQSPTSVVVKQFFDAKYREIADVFQNYPDREVYEKLSNYDQEHRSTYQDWKTRP